MKVERIAWAVGGIGIVGSVLGAVFQPDTFAYSWLAAASVWYRWPLGCLALLLIHALTGGRWGMVTRPWLLIGLATLPLLLPAIVPVLLLLPHLYPWARSDAHLDNAFYLNLRFAGGRWIFYLVVWFGIAAIAALRARRDQPIGGFAAPALILLGLTANFAAYDAVLSLDPHFNSSDFGMVFNAEGGLFALAITIFGTVLTEPLEASDRNDLGRLLQALLVLWAYLDFMQLLIVWQSNLPKEAAWYAPRAEGIWIAAAALTALAHFLLPFATLLFPRLRKSRRGLLAVTSLLIVMSVIRGWWLVLPAHERGLSWIDFAAVLALGGIAVGMVTRGARGRLQVAHA